MMLWGWGGAGMGAGGWAMMIIWAIFWVVVFVAIILLIRHLVVRSDEGRWNEEEKHAAQGHHMWHRSSALSILAERYARGEIDREEFLRRKADLS
jgi:putative membrane protein